MLTKREQEVMNLKAIGLSDKEISYSLAISVETVKKIMCKIKERVQLYKATELVAWWWCEHFGGNFEQIRKQILSVLMLLLIIPQTVSLNEEVVRVFRTRRVYSFAYRCCGRKNESEANMFEVI